MVVQHLLPLLLATAFATVAAQDAGQTRVPSPPFETAPCPFTADAKVMEQVRCGYVTVPENRAVPSGRGLKLAVAKLKSLSATPRPDPMVLIGGGPGGRTMDRIPGFLANGTMDAVRADRDVIVYDQRGVGYSEPMFCPEATAELGARRVESHAAYRARQREQLARCGEYMRAAGYDLSQYNSHASAHDLQDLRRALGVEQWNLHAASYGTRLALVAMRVAPQGIRSVVLDSPSPPNRAAWFNKPADYVDILKRLSAACAAQSTCNDAFPDLEQTLWRTVEDFDRAPRTRTVTLPSGTSATLIANGSMLAGAVAGLLERGAFSAVPMAVYAAASGNEVALTTLTQALVSRLDANATGPRFGWGLHYTVNCFEEAPLNTPELRQRTRSAYPSVLIDGDLFPDPSLCEGLHAFRATPEQTLLPESEIPTLVFVGEFDLQTHRSNGEIVTQSLKNSQMVEVRGAGHVPSLRHECTRTMIRDFYNTLRPVDTSCLTSIPPLRFVTDLKTIAK